MGNKTATRSQGARSNRGQQDRQQGNKATGQQDKTGLEERGSQAPVWRRLECSTCGSHFRPKVSTGSLHQQAQTHHNDDDSEGSRGLSCVSAVAVFWDVFFSWLFLDVFLSWLLRFGRVSQLGAVFWPCFSVGCCVLAVFLSWLLCFCRVSLMFAFLGMFVC